jgi:hypothetical protein
MPSPDSSGNPFVYLNRRSLIESILNKRLKRIAGSCFKY